MGAADGGLIVPPQPRDVDEISVRDEQGGDSVRVAILPRFDEGPGDLFRLMQRHPRQYPCLLFQSQMYQA